MFTHLLRALHRPECLTQPGLDQCIHGLNLARTWPEPEDSFFHILDPCPINFFVSPNMAPNLTSFLAFPRTQPVGLVL